MLNTSQILYLSPFLISLLIMVWTGAFAWKRRKVSGATEFSLFIGVQVLWCLGFMLELTSTTLEWKLFWDDVQWPFTVLSATIFGLFILRYTRGFKLNKKYLGFLLALVIPLVIYSATDQLHHTIRGNIHLEEAQPFSAMTYEYSWGFYLVSISSFIVTTVGIIILIISIFKGQREFYKQSLTILIGVMIPLIGSLLTLLDVVLYTYRDTSPISFALGGVVVLWGLIKYSLFDIVPVAMRTVLDTIDDAVFVFDGQRRIVFMNQAGGKALRVELKDVLGKTAKDIFPGHDADVDYFRSVEQAEQEIETINPDGVKQQYMVKLLPLFSDSKQNIGRVVVLNNITRFKQLNQKLQKHNEQTNLLVEKRTAELKQRNQDLLDEVELRKEAEEKIAANLEEKTAMVHEINHRVRNNMAIIMSLLNMQSRYLDSSSAAKPIMEIHNRIYSMSLIHTMMYHTGDFKHVSIQDYLHRLYSHIIHQKRTGLKLDFKVEMNQVTLPIEKAIPVGLILNEVISNAILHAFPKLESGEISVKGEYDEQGCVTFTISDNGVGFDKTILDKADTFGLKMVHLLAEQLEGVLSFNLDKGTQVEIHLNATRTLPEPFEQPEDQD